MGKMLKFDAEASERLAGLIEACGYPVDKKKMFGHETYFLNGYMYSGANVEGIFINVGADQVAEALCEDKGLKSFSPMEGMAMKDYLQIPSAMAADDETVKTWLQRSAEYLMRRPPKKKKPPRKRKA